ncbi:2Fe-2S iron-sulfur cluster-binding protein [Benzoatithermus flavus]|uniref:2Fe-2S iron-sulfur cluster-binding protein n=1 Tax=Benzoatithermus flavus TaxID=3108223 RepID=A0ABU8XTX2_9PROT
MDMEAKIAAHLADARGTWDADTDDALVCRQVRPETHDVKTFILEARRPRLFRYRPGQFLTFDFAIDGLRINRCYTISSTPTRPHLIAITVKRVPGGPVSNWLHDRLEPGMELRATGPLGEFTSLAHPAQKYLFLSGGSGITPLMSMARAYHDLALPRDIVFVHFARTPADIIFRAELELMARNLPSFRFVPVCEADGPGERWAGFSGRVSPPLLRLIAPDFLEREVMVCGPAPFMAAVRGILAGAEFDMARHHEESFDFATPAGGTEEEMAAPAARVFKIEFRKSGRTVACGAGSSVLAAAKAAGMRLPSSCSKGLCGTCKSRLVSGEVDMKHQGGIRQREIEQGMVLLCCAKPLTDLVVDR